MYRQERDENDSWNDLALHPESLITSGIKTLRYSLSTLTFIADAAVVIVGAVVVVVVGSTVAVIFIVVLNITHAKSTCLYH